MCDGNCGNCKSPCSLSSISPKLEQIINHAKKEPNQSGGEEMSFLGQKNDNLKTQGCGAPKDPEIVLAYKTINEINRSVADLENKINNIGSSTPLSFGIKSAILVAVFLAVIGTALGLFGIYQIAIISNSVQTANANAAAAVNAATIAQERSSSAQERSDKNYNYLRQMKSDISSVK